MASFADALKAGEDGVKVLDSGDVDAKSALWEELLSIAEGGATRLPLFVRGVPLL
jgi:hypothetical protein